MSIQLEPRENGHVLYYTFTDPWSAAEIGPRTMEAARYCGEARFKVHSIFDLRASKNIPTGVINARRDIAVLNHPNAGYTAIVGATRLARSVADILKNLIRFDRMLFFDSADEAWTFIRQAITSES